MSDKVCELHTKNPFPFNIDESSLRADVSVDACIDDNTLLRRISRQIDAMNELEAETAVQLIGDLSEALGK